MSTILRALKKAEQECPDSPGAVDRHVGFKSRDRMDDTLAPKEKSRKRPGWLITVAVFLVLAGAVISIFKSKDLIFMSQKAPVSVVSKDKRHSFPTDVAAKADGAQKGESVPESRADSALAGHGAALLEGQGSGEKPVRPAGQVHRAKTRPTHLKNLPPVLSHQPFDPNTLPAPVAKKSVPVKRVATQAPLEKVVPANTDHAGLPKGSDDLALAPGGLKIQAISWSRTPLARIAVINEKVLGENDTIEGYQIITINENEVILSGSHGEKSRLVFKTR